MFDCWIYVCVLRCLQSLKMLNDEETTDNELRTKFNQRWNRTPSGDLYKPLRAGTCHIIKVCLHVAHC